jgi:glycosyltransferase involved in cell wall biosynthesis
MTERARRAAILVIGAMPPPTHGYSIITAAMADHLRAVAHVEVVDISPDTLVRSWLYHAQRLYRVGRALVRLMMRRPREGRTAYLAVSGGAAVVFDLLLTSTARMVGYRLFIHHHAFSYIDRRSSWTAALVAAAGHAAVHICLCPTMASRLHRQYFGVRNIAIQSNAAFIAPGSSPRRAGSGPFRLGFLSNLIPEKGLDTVIEVFRSLRQRHTDVVLVVAGPASFAASRSLIEDAKQEFGDALDYRGAIYGAEKASFFRDIDIFLFPTRYVNEAQPLVMLEALAAGVPVIATARGCIPDDLGAGGTLVDPVTEYATAAVPILTACLSDRSRITTLSTAALDRATELHRSASQALHDLIETMTALPKQAMRDES